MKIAATPIAGVMVVEGQRHADARGSFARLFCDEALAGVLGERRVVQINHSRTADRGAVRGMHYQRAPHAEMKLVRCLNGRIWDVAVDLRARSPTFLRWHAQELSADNERMMVIPEGCAHGFQALEDDCELLYLHTAAYAAGAEGGVDCRDPRLAIAWPLPVTALSARDSSHPPLTGGFEGLAP
jgi:dTDP-4-dehydrorhamnose 3,5-epimerase